MADSPSANEANANDSTSPAPESEGPKLEAGIALWLLLFAFGGGALARYYSQIGYFPEIDWRESLSYVGVLSIIGGWISVTLGLLVFVPGFIWSEYLIFDPTVQNTMCFIKKGRAEPCLWAIAPKLVFPYLLIVLLYHLLAITLGSWAAIIGSLAGLTAGIYYVWNKYSLILESDASISLQNDRKSRLTKYVFFFSVSVLLSLFSLMVIHRIVANEKAWLLLIVCTSVVVLANLLVAIQYRVSLIRAIATSAIAATVLLIAGETLRAESSLLSRIMSQYGFCAQENATLVASGEACIALAAQEFSFTPLDKGLCKVENVAVLSRLGSDVFFRAQSKRASLPKKLVVAWLVPSATEKACPTP